MSKTRDDSTTRATLRKQLLTNGFEPLPLDGKACYIKGWSRDHITEEWLTPYARSGKYSNTGIRCCATENHVGGLVAVDIDIDNRELADRAEDICCEVLGHTPLLRYGKGEKRLLVYWVWAAERKRRTLQYGDDGYMVEFLCRGSQFAAFGMHPSGVDYDWPDKSPLDVDLNDVPAVDAEQLARCRDMLDEMLESTGLAATQHAGGEGGENSHDYCLTDDMQFEIIKPDRGLMAVADIRNSIERDTWHCNMTAFRPGSDSGAGRVSMASDGSGIRITDFVDDITYFEAFDATDGAPQSVLDNVVAQGADDGPLFMRAADADLQDIVARYVYVWRDSTVRPVIDPATAFPKNNFLAAHMRPVASLSGRASTMGAAFMERGTQAHHAALRPDIGRRFFEEGPHTVLNTYTPPTHPDAGGEADTFYAFIDHLVPTALEREFLLDWIANKVQRPWQRAHGVVMVTPTYGTGRGTLFQILTRLLGPHYCVQVPLAHLNGQTSQGQYNDYLTESLLVNVPEALDDHDNRGRWYARHASYEALKEVIDTTSERVMVRRKGVRNSVETVYASVLISSNHQDALAIPPDDRRLVVIENGRTPLTRVAGLRDRIHAWLRDNDNIGALYRSLRARPVVYDPAGEPMDTPAKRRMVAAAESGLDIAWRALLDTAVGDLITFPQWRTFAQWARDEMDLDDNWPTANSVERGLKNVYTAGTDPLDPERGSLQIRLDGAQRVRPRILRNRDKWQADGVLRDLDRLRVELLKNGDPGGGVVAFPGGGKS